MLLFRLTLATAGAEYQESNLLQHFLNDLVEDKEDINWTAQKSRNSESYEMWAKTSKPNRKF